ncbi:MAG: hypothetical protein NTW74_24590 [Acidobacteria bacterium]|nr:hypothetical protein [Acidobacteriota bacterium]
MSTQAQINANRQNAKKSTGPKTPEGRAASAANSTRHGLTANHTTIFENNPHERSQYDSLKAKLLKQFLPEGELELQAFERYVFALFQSDRARQMEIDAQERWLNEPSNDKLLAQMDRILKLGAAQERRADRALSEFKKIQTDRILAMDIHTELYLFDKKMDIPATFPMFEIRKSDLSKTSAGLLAVRLMAILPEARAIMENKTKPIEEQNPVSQDEIRRFVQSVMPSQA